MLKLKKEIKLEILLNYGFIRSADRTYYYIKYDMYDIFIWTSPDESFKRYYLYINTEHATIIENIDIIVKLLKDKIIEEVKR